MKKARQKQKNELRPEYKPSDFKAAGVRGRYYTQCRAGTNLVLLSPDVATAFPTEEAVNDALRSLIRLARQSRPTPRSRATRPKAARTPA